ncbi:hypothetical protein HDV03_003794 [Kappamyces sp. JEL0829]|nr:hypothetical protein HDV03_003794 [Kappamyces sp. JEL0829]
MSFATLLQHQFPAKKINIQVLDSGNLRIHKTGHLELELANLPGFVRELVEHDRCYEIALDKPKIASLVLSGGQTKPRARETASVLWQVPFPGDPFDATFARILYHANLTSLALTTLGHDVVSTRPIMLPPASDRPDQLALLLLCWIHHKTDHQPLDSVYISQLCRRHSAAFSEQEIADTKARMEKQDPALTRVWSDIVAYHLASLHASIKSHCLLGLVEIPTTVPFPAPATKSGFLQQQIVQEATGQIDWLYVCFHRTIDHYVKIATQDLSKTRLVSIHTSFAAGSDYELKTAPFCLDQWFTSAFAALDQSVVDCKPEITMNLAKAKVVFPFFTTRNSKTIDLKAHAGNDLGIHIQYSHARLMGIQRYLEDEGLLPEFTAAQEKQEIDWSVLDLVPRVYDLIELLYSWDQVLLKCVGEANVLASYLGTLSKLTSSLYYHLRIKGESRQVQLARWVVFARCKHVLEQSIKLCGLEPILEV